MLVLSRKIGEGIQIGDGIEVAILSVRNGRVRLGLAAPQAVTIRRSELDRPIAADGPQQAIEPVERRDP